MVELQPAELTVSAIERGRTVQKPVSKGKFLEYVEISSDLGLIQTSSGSKCKLTAEGFSAWSENGAQFNEVLVRQLTTALAKTRLTIEALRDHLFKLAEQGRLPNLDNLVRLLLEERQAMPAKKPLRLYLRLLGYTGLLQKATNDTYFPG